MLSLLVVTVYALTVSGDGVCTHDPHMQAELVKFQEVLLLIQDYYSSMQGAMPPQLPTPARVPLIEVCGPSAVQAHSIYVHVYACTSNNEDSFFSSAGVDWASGPSVQQH